MNTKQQNFISMVRSLANLFTKWTTTWTGIPAIQKEVDAMNAETVRIDTLSEQTQLSPKGITENKSNARDEALSAIVGIAKPASIYALDAGNMELHRKLCQSRGSLSQLPQNDLLNTLFAVYAEIEKIKEHLSDYGITEPLLQQARVKLDAFASAVPAPRDAIVSRKTNNELIVESIARLRHTLYRLDNLMKIFSETEFYAEYRNARVVVDLGARKKNSGETPQP